MCRRMLNVAASHLPLDIVLDEDRSRAHVDRIPIWMGLVYQRKSEYIIANHPCLIR